MHARLKWIQFPVFFFLVLLFSLVVSLMSKIMEMNFDAKQNSMTVFVRKNWFLVNRNWFSCCVCVCVFLLCFGEIKPNAPFSYSCWMNCHYVVAQQQQRFWRCNVNQIYLWNTMEDFANMTPFMFCIMLQISFVSHHINTCTGKHTHIPIANWSNMFEFLCFV